MQSLTPQGKGGVQCAAIQTNYKGFRDCVGNCQGTFQKSLLFRTALI